MKDSLFNYFLAGLLTCFLLPTMDDAKAQESESTVKVSGFGTLGASYNPSRDFDFIRDLLQSSGVGYSKRFDLGLDSRLGLQITAKANEQIEFTGQVVSRRSLHQFRPEVTWAYMKYMSTDTPNVIFSLKGSKILGGHVELQSQNWLARVGYTELVFANEFPNFEPILATLRSPMLAMFAPSVPQLARRLQFKDKKMRYVAAGLVYDNGPLQAQWMASRIHSDTLGFASTGSAFFTLAYRVHGWTPYFNFAQTFPLHLRPVVTGLPTQLDPSLQQLEMGIQSIATATLSKQTTRSIGVRYALSPNSDLKFQIDHLTNSNTLLIRTPQANWNGKGTIYTCTYNFVF